MHGEHEKSILNMRTMRLSLSPVFSVMGVPTYYEIRTLKFSVDTSTTYEEVEHSV